MLSRLAATVVGHLSTRPTIHAERPVTDREREYLRAASDARGTPRHYSIRF